MVLTVMTWMNVTGMVLINVMLLLPVQTLLVHTHVNVMKDSLVMVLFVLDWEVN